jgi:hypothetical protein
MAGILASHSVITPLDLMLAAIASVAVIIALIWNRRSGRKADVMDYVVIWARYFFGVHMFMSGANYFIHWAPQMEMQHPLAGPFQHYMEVMGLFAVIKAVETAVSLCLIFGVFVPAALIMEVPISFNIFYLSVFVVADPRTMWTGPREIFLNLFLLAAYFGWLKPLLNPRLPTRPIWRREGADA